MIDERKLRAHLNELIVTTNEGWVRRDEWHTGLKHACDLTIDKLNSGDLNADSAPPLSGVPNFLFMRDRNGDRFLVNLDLVTKIADIGHGIVRIYFGYDDDELHIMKGDFDRLTYFLGTGDGSEEGL